VSSWNRRVAAATRVRETADSDDVKERLQAHGLPRGLHPDDAAAIAALLRVAEARTGAFSTTVLARIRTDGTTHRLVRITVMGNESGGTALVGDSSPDLALDPLTGLPGRDHLLRALEDVLAGSVDDDRSVAVYTIDIDRFKTLNDTRGFAAGDEALRALAARLEASLRPDDVLTRVGGDQFTIVCPDVFGVAEAATLGERFRSSCIEAAADGPLGGLTISIGAALGSAARGAEQTVRDAETALHQAKGCGRDRCEVFDEDLRSRAERRNTVDQRLRQALDDDAVEVHYQPVIDLETETIVGCEALVRIVAEDGTHLDPRELIGAAEDSGLIRRIEETVLHRAAVTMRRLTEVTDAPLWVSVNISDRRLLDSRFPLALARTLHHADLPVEQVHLELHPATIARKGPGTRLVTQLRALGVCVVIDEFAGTGEIDHIGPDAVDLVKLDKQLVRDLRDERGRARAELVIGSIIERGVDVCAVGVETPAELDVVRELGCRYGQGYLFSPPVDADRLATLLTGRD